MSWKSTPAMAGERCIVDKVQVTANDESHYSIKVGCTRGAAWGAGEEHGWGAT